MNRINSNILNNKTQSSKHIKYTVIIILSWSLILGSLLLIDLLSIKQYTNDLAINEARSHFNKDEAFRFWSATHGGFYVPVSDRTSPSPYLSHIPERDILTTSGKQLTLMNPAWALRQMNEDFIETYGVAGHITSLLPLRPENSPDKWEKKSLELFENGELEVIEFADIQNKPFLRLMKPLITQEGCLVCHSHQGYSVGDVRGGVSVSVPLEPYLSKEKNTTTKHVFSFALLWILGLGIIIQGYRRIRKSTVKQESSEKKLYNSKRQLEAVYNNLDALIYISDMQSYKILYINDHMEKQYGKDLIGSICWKSLHIDMDGPCTFCTNNKLIDKKGNPTEPFVWEIYNEKLKRWYELHDQAIPWTDGRLVRLEMAMDTTDRKHLEEEINHQLADKEIILKEAHHRIKNNFASIVSLLSLQVNSISNPEAISALQDAIGRVSSMQILYEKLLLTDNYNVTSIKQYLENLIDEIISLFPDNINISLKKQIDDFELDSKRLVPIGIIINELLTNTMKYGFPEKNSGLLHITVVKNNGNVTLSIQDDGIGLPDGFNIKKQKGFGLMLVKILSQQLKGNFTIENNNGTKSTLEFSI